MKRSEALAFSDMNKEQKRSLVLKRLSVCCFILAVALLAVSFLVTLPGVQKQLADINAWFYQIEMFIARFDKLAAVAVIIFFFFIKCFIPVIPFSVLFIGSGLVFSVPVAATVNIMGFALLVSLKFLWGRRFGGGGAHKLILRSRSVTDFMGFDGKGNEWMLVILSFIPFIPVGTVSRAYGATNMRLLPFVILSVLGFLPRLISWSVLGCNITDPFTPGFMAPIIILAIISGLSLLLLDAIFKFTRKEVNDEKN